jgi:hypothetical protein
MKDIYQIFDEKFETLQKLAEEKNFFGSETVVTDIIKVASMFGYKDGVFIAEVLEAIYGQTAYLFQDYELAEKDQKEVIETAKKCLAIIAKSYRKTDKNEIFDALKEFRNEITELQIRCYNTLTPKPDVERIPIRRRRY